MQRLLLALAVLLLAACVTVPPQQVKPKPPLAERQAELFATAKASFQAQDYGNAAALLLPLAQQGHLEAQYTIGYMYHYGLGLPRNEREALHWFSIAAARGHAKAQQALKMLEAESAGQEQPQ